MELTIKRFDELTLQELYEILALRVSVFVVEQGCPYQEIDGKDPYCYHVSLRDGDGIQAYLRVADAGVSYDDAPAIGRVIARRRGCGLGAQVLAAGIGVARTRLHAGKVRIGAQTYARAFYEKAGFRQSTAEYLEDGIPHIGMVLALE